MQERTKENIAVWVVVVLLGLIIVGIAVTSWFSSRTVTLHLYGSRLVGEKLMMSLAEKFLEKQEANPKIDNSKINQGVVTVTGILPKDKTKVNIEIRSRATDTSDTAFNDLMGEKCELGFMWRKINPAENQQMVAKGMGDLTASDNYFQLAQDRVVVIVHPSNPITSLSMAQVKGIFKGEINRWDKLFEAGSGGLHGAIKVYAPSDKTEIYQVFKKHVLAGENVVSKEELANECFQVRDKVANDPASIGFVNLPEAKPEQVKTIEVMKIDVAEDETTDWAKAILTADEGANGGTGIYQRIEQPVLVYWPKTANAQAQEFINWIKDFAGSQPGQSLITERGFRPLLPEAHVGDDWPYSYREIKAFGTLVFQCNFESGRSALNRKALDGLAEAARSTLQARNRGLRKILILGFADTKGEAIDNVKLSQDRARVVRQELERRMIKPLKDFGFGDRAPLEPREATDEQRKRNRRVEIYLMP